MVCLIPALAESCHLTITNYCPLTRNPASSLLRWWRSCWRCKAVSSICVARSLHLRVLLRLSAAEIPLVFSVVPAVLLRLVIGWWSCLLLLLRVIRIVGSRPMTGKRHPTGCSIRLATHATSPASANEAEDEKYQDSPDNNCAQCHPSSPVVPS